MKWKQESDIKWILETINGDLLCEVIKSKFKVFIIRISHKLRDNDSQISADTLIEAQGKFIEIYSNRLSNWVNILDDKELILQNILNPFEEEIDEEEVDEIILEATVDDSYDDDEDFNYQTYEEDEDDYANDKNFDGDEDSEPFVDWEEESKKYTDDTPYGDSTDSPSEDE
ncbi:MAG: hypothetical protein ACOCVF_01470 [bacterium]